MRVWWNGNTCIWNVQSVHVENIKMHSNKAAFAENFIVKNAAEMNLFLVDTHSEHAPSNTTCKQWFRQFSNNDFDVDYKERGGASKKFKDTILRALLDGTPRWPLEELSKKSNVGRSTVTKRLRWEWSKKKNIGLKERNIETTFLRRIDISDEKWTYHDKRTFENNIFIRKSELENSVTPSCLPDSAPSNFCLFLSMQSAFSGDGNKNLKKMWLSGA